MTETVVNYVLPDIPRIYTALAEWLACLALYMSEKACAGLEACRSGSGNACIAVCISASKGGAEGVWWMLVWRLPLLYVCVSCDLL